MRTRNAERGARNLAKAAVLMWLGLAVLALPTMAVPPFKSPRCIVPAPAAGGGGGGVGSPGIENTQTTNSQASSSTCSIGIVVGSGGLNRAIGVWVAQCGASLSSVSIGGSSGTRVGTPQQLQTYTCSNALYYLVAPATGNQTITATFSAAVSECALIIHSWTNINQTTPFGTLASSTSVGTSGAITNTISCADRDVGYDSLNHYSVTGFTYTPGTGQTAAGTAQTDNFTSLKSSTRPITTTTTNMYWTVSPSAEIAHMAVAAKAIP